MAEERPEKRQRLTPNDWESKVLGSGEYIVLPDNTVPFAVHPKTIRSSHVLVIPSFLCQCLENKTGQRVHLYIYHK